MKIETNYHKKKRKIETNCRIVFFYWEQETVIERVRDCETVVEFQLKFAARVRDSQWDYKWNLEWSLRRENLRKLNKF
jgi:hypothetical protein